LIEHIEESGKYQHPARAVGPPAAKEKLLKKFLFGFSSKRFDGRRERIAAALPLPTPYLKSFMNNIPLKTLSQYLFTCARRSGGANAPASPRALKRFERDFKGKLFQKFSLKL